MSAVTPVTGSDIQATRLRIRSGIAVVFLRVAGIALLLLVNVVVARRLSPAEFGYFLLATHLIFAVGILGRFGLDRSMVRLLAECVATGNKHRLLNSLSSSVRLLVCSSSLALVVFILLLTVGGIYRFVPRFDLAMCIVCCAILLGNVTIQLLADYMRGLQSVSCAALFDARASGPVINFVFATLLLGSGVFSVPYRLHGCLVLLLISLSTCVPIAAIAFIRILRQQLRKMGDVNNRDASPEMKTRLLLMLSLPIAASQLIDFLCVYGDIWIAGALTAAEHVAEYGVARRLVQVVAMPLFMANTIVIGQIPAMWARNEKQALSNHLQGMAAVAFGLSVVACVVCWCYPSTLVRVIFGEQYSLASTIVCVLLVGQLVFSWTGSSAQVLMMTGHERDVLLTTLVTSICMLACGIVATAYYGIIGLAVSSCIVESAKNLWMWQIALQRTGLATNATLQLNQGPLLKTPLLKSGR